MAESTAVAGYNGKVYISTDGGSTYTEIAQLQDCEMNISADMLDASTKATVAGGWKQKKPGMLDWSATAGSLRATGDAANATIFNALVARTALTFRFDPEGTAAGKPRYTGTGYLKGWKESSPLNDLTKIGVDIEGSGQLALSTQ